MKTLLLTLLLASAALSHAATAPTLIPFQGRLTDQAGTIYTNGQYTLIFNLYDQAVGGNVLWTETHQKVGVVNGMVNVFLGSINPALASVDFSQTRHLGITIDADNNPNTPDPEMVPRQMIIPAFFAQGAANANNSAKLAGYDWTPLFGANNPNGTLLASRVGAGTLPGSVLQPGSLPGSVLSINSISSQNIMAGAILSSNIANGAVGPDSLYSRQVGTNVGVGGLAVSSTVFLEERGGNSPALSDIVRTTVSIQTQGKPVRIYLSSALCASGNPGLQDVDSSYIEAFGTFATVGGVYVQFVRDGNVIVGQSLLRASAGNVSPPATAIPPSAFDVIDLPPAGTHSYMIRVSPDRGSMWVTIRNIRLIAYEF